MKIISNDRSIPAKLKSRKKIASDKSMKEICERFTQMESEGRARIVRSTTVEELSKLPPDQLHDTERAMLMYYKNLGGDFPL